MGWVQRLLAAIGIGGARVTIELDSAEHPRGSEVRGQVVLDGGEVEQQVDNLVLRLVEYEPSGESERTTELDLWELARDLTIEAHQQERFPFVLALGDDARLTTQPGMLRGAAGIRLQAEAHMPWGISPHQRQPLEVVVNREVTAVLEAMELLGFQRASDYRSYLFSPAPGTTVQAFAATGDLARILDGAALELYMAGDVLAGELEINSREQGLGERLRALMGSDKRSYQLSIAREELLTAEGRPNVAAAVLYLERILAMVPDPHAPENLLLRPAEAPADGALLLRPAAGAADTPADRLLRPAGEKP